jgi:hypothetical protein
VTGTGSFDEARGLLGTRGRPGEDESGSNAGSREADDLLTPATGDAAAGFLLLEEAMFSVEKKADLPSDDLSQTSVRRRSKGASKAGSVNFWTRGRAKGKGRRGSLTGQHDSDHHKCREIL